MLLIVISPLATWQAIKLNHNSILVSLWPLAILAFLRFREQPTAIRGLLLGIAAGLALLAKFYSALLLAAMLCVLLPDLRRWIVRPGAWIAAVVATAMIAPHLIWLTGVQPEAIILGAPNRPEDAGSIRNLLTRNLTNTSPPLIALLVCVLTLVGWGGLRRPRIEASDRTEYRTVLLLFVLPWCATLIANVLLELRGSATWTMPAFATQPVLLAGLLPTERAAPRRRALLTTTAALMLLAVAAAPIVLYALFRKGHPAAVEPRYELARMAEEVWRAAVPGRPLRVTAGEIQFGFNAALVLPTHPTTWVNFMPLPYLSRIEIDTAGYLAMCETDDPKCLARTRKRTAGSHTLTCILETNRTLFGLRGKPMRIAAIVVPPVGQEPRPLPGCTMQAPGTT
jgi:hypothetical protein